MKDEHLIEKFEQCQLPPGEFHHDTHIRLAWTYLNRHSLPEALIKIREGIKAFAECHNVPDLYHETITFAYAILINERIASRPGLSWTEFQRSNSALFDWKPSILNQYYSEELLNSPSAKSCLVMPNRIGADSTEMPIDRAL